jgi:hypothetical protein
VVKELLDRNVNIKEDAATATMIEKLIEPINKNIHEQTKRTETSKGDRQKANSIKRLEKLHEELNSMNNKLKEAQGIVVSAVDTSGGAAEPGDGSDGGAAAAEPGDGKSKKKKKKKNKKKKGGMRTRRKRKTKSRRTRRKRKTKSRRTRRIKR